MDKVTNKAILEQTGLQSNKGFDKLEDLLTRKNFRWTGHLEQRDKWRAIVKCLKQSLSHRDRRHDEYRGIHTCTYALVYARVEIVDVIITCITKETKLHHTASDSRLREPAFESCAAVLKPWASFFKLYIAPVYSAI